ncbi:MAG: ABC transporter ATP-binding protein [Planctomycetota bacterium]
MSLVLRSRGLSKWYGEVIAVNDLDLAIDTGITALLGPNGAGKSTLIGLVTGQLRATRGTVEVFGEPVWDNPALNARIGLCHQYDDFYEDMTAREFVRLMARLSGFSRADSRRRADETLERVGLEAEARDRKIRGYSKGMRQRTKIAQALIHDPDLLLLDEPMTGLDPVGRHEVTRLIQDLAAAGKSVIVSTHILHEVEALTERILVLAQGRLVADGDLHEIRESLENHPYAIRVVCDRPRRLAEIFVALPGVSEVEVKDETAGAEELVIRTKRADLVFAELPRRLREEGIRATEISSPDDNLEAVFDFLVS